MEVENYNAENLSKQIKNLEDNFSELSENVCKIEKDIQNILEMLQQFQFATVEQIQGPENPQEDIVKTSDYKHK